MKETTANDLVVGEATDEEAAAFKLDPHLINLMLNEPFFSHVIRDFNRIKTEQVPTAGVGVRNQTPTLYWNPKFLARLKPKQVRGVMKHECYHYVFKHCTDRKLDPHILWNWATDLAINSQIPRDELPEEGLFAGYPLDLSKITDPERLKKWQKVSDLIESLPPLMSGEWYFKKLQEDEEVKDTIEGKGEPGDGSGRPGEMDDHGEWGEMSDEDRQVVEGKMRQSLSEAVRKCDGSGNWGSVSAEMRGDLRKMVSNQIDWKKLLEAFCGRSQRMNKRNSMRRINRKYPYIHPGTRYNHTSNIAVYVDQSGSVDDESLNLLFGELSHLGKKVTFTLFPFDTSVDEEASVVWKKGTTVPAFRTRYGGTCFHAVNRHVTKNRGKFDGHLILTDGECSDPGPSRSRRGWVIVPGRKLYFDAHPGDILIQMESKS